MYLIDLSVTFVYQLRVDSIDISVTMGAISLTVSMLARLYTQVLSIDSFVNSVAIHFDYCRL